MVRKTTMVNIHLLDKKIPKYEKKKMTKLKGVKDHPVTLAGDFNIHFQ